jgi:hypothetical protein
MYEAGSYPFGYIGPISIIWKAMATASSSEPTKDSSAAPKLTGKRKRKQAKKSNGKNTLFVLQCL